MNSHPQGPSATSATSHPRIRILGYGEGGGREHARRLRDRGHDVRVAMLAGGMSWEHAIEDGFRPTRVRTAIVDADVIVVLVPEDEVELLFWEHIAPLTPAGTLVVLSEALELDEERMPNGVDVVVIAMGTNGYAVTVRSDATGHAHDRALAYLQAVGGNVPRPTSSRMRVVDDADPFPHPSQRVL